MALTKAQAKRIAEVSLASAAQVFLGSNAVIPVIRAAVPIPRRRTGTLGELGTKITPTQTDAQAAEQIMAEMGLTPEQYDYYAAMTGAPKRGPTPQELHDSLLTQISGLAGGSDVQASVETIQAKPGYANFAKRATEAGYDPVQLINERNANIHDYKKGGIAKQIGTFLDKSGIAKVITYGTILAAGAGAVTAITGAGAGAGGAAGGSSSGAATGATGATATASPLTAAHAAAMQTALAPIAAPTGTALTTGATAIKAATAVKSAAGAAATTSGILDQVKTVAPKVVDGINKARTIEAVANGDVPPPPIDIGSGSMTDWASAIADQYVQQQMTDAEKELVAQQIRELQAKASTIPASGSYYPAPEVPTTIQSAMLGSKDFNILIALGAAALAFAVAGSRKNAKRR